ncbi:NodT family efflux transporter outer membrane factor (OMF) lipoprotein [Rhodothalassium salexigens DSM 2132]|uniref:NodT family efflux transporter outer membrane factor (OMF) lipoprotein n=1 Tax=Rhodothalassium salexigens DSM 2132 TaxID=1188247 RepID=A0A4R2PKP9_RHOSA|nr:efflux transporter outer membrane subunit [Rhodothalassium salexigens]MBB4211493.1 NodT family efflux transporter outer membrane factor (OMF) lipoprotein [Rhodothalassium salexigens DSM 2132]MBK1640015.1 RND transporter [Rhodothalassium salexigens DSM 2132]TCP34575.1 NodT family efflux transporter outer membrane factor (OMF) lipoprotein [Rhodothalassium salexigens DSM 2132]
MRTRRLIPLLGAACVSTLLQACAPSPTAVSPDMVTAMPDGATLPDDFAGTGEDQNSAGVPWRQFFDDPTLVALIDTALDGNQELNILLQEISVAQNEVRARSGEYLPFVSLQAGAGVEKAGRYTRDGAVEEQLHIKEDREFPEPLPDFLLSARASWEIDIWKKLRNAKKAQVLRYLATAEGRRFAVTHVVAEIAHAYYELKALDTHQAILRRMIETQEAALKTVKLQKAAGKATALAVRKFDAEVLKNKSELFAVAQEITETENRLNLLIGRYPRAIDRRSDDFATLDLPDLHVGTPRDLLSHRPDVRQAELALAAAKLDIEVARARFYPSLDLTAAVGVRSFQVGSIATMPESLLYNVAADLMVPLFNRKAIHAAYDSANARQLQALYDYQRTVLKAYVEVANLVSRLDNLDRSLDRKRGQVDALSNAIDIATRLFKSARADYMEVLMTQRDALEATLELVAIKQSQVDAWISAYQALGGGTEGAPAQLAATPQAAAEGA